MVTHKSLVTALINWAVMLQNRRRLAEAEAVYLQALDSCRLSRCARRRSGVNPEPPWFLLPRRADCRRRGGTKPGRGGGVWAGSTRNTLSYLKNLGDLHARTGDWEEAIALHSEALGVRRRVKGVGHNEVAQSANDLAVAYAGLGDDASAETLFREALGVVPPRPSAAIIPRPATAQCNLGGLLLRRDRSSKGDTTSRGGIRDPAESRGARRSRPAALRPPARASLRRSREPLGGARSTRSLSAFMRRGEVHLSRPCGPRDVGGRRLSQNCGALVTGAEEIYLFAGRYFEEHGDTLRLRLAKIQSEPRRPIPRADQSECKALAGSERTARLGGRRDSLEYATVLNLLAESWRDERDYDRAITLYTGRSGFGSGGKRVHP